MTQRAHDDLIRAVEALTPEQRDWSPAETSRSALHMMREIAVSTDLLTELIRSGQSRNLDGHSHGSMIDQEQSFEDALTRSRESTANLCTLIATFPDEKLEDDVVLPFGGGIRMTMADCLALHHWNLTYHTGQVNYIQTILGDMKMH